MIWKNPFKAIYLVGYTSKKVKWCVLNGLKKGIVLSFRYLERNIHFQFNGAILFVSTVECNNLYIYLYRYYQLLTDLDSHHYEVRIKRIIFKLANIYLHVYIF